MKRNPALASLSREHHLALTAAHRLRRCTAETTRAARAHYLALWEREGRDHFRVEEDVLLPAYGKHGDPYEPVVARMLCDHVRIRQRTAALLGDAEPSVNALRELGALLAHHIRLEEREVFPLIEATLSDEELAAL